MTSRCPRCTLLGFTLSALLHLGAAAAILASGTTPETPLVDGHRVAVNLAMFEGPSERQAPTTDVNGTGEPPGSPKASPEPNPSAEREPEPGQTPEPATVPDPEEDPETVSARAPDAAPKLANAPELNTTPNPKLKVAPPALTPKRKTSPERATKPIPKPKPEARSEAKSKYAGKARSPSGRTEEQSGSAGARGLSGSAATSAKGGGKEGDVNAKALESQYLAGLQRAIAKKRRYPSSARRRGETGVVTVSFVLAQSGRISGARVDKSSGSARLDQAALRTLKRLGRHKAIPKALGRTSWRLRVPIRFALE